MTLKFSLFYCQYTTSPLMIYYWLIINQFWVINTIWMIYHPILNHSDYITAKLVWSNNNVFVFVTEVLNLFCLGQWLCWMSYVVAKTAIFIPMYSGLELQTEQQGGTTSLCSRMSRGSSGKGPKLGSDSMAGARYPLELFLLT